MAKINSVATSNKIFGGNKLAAGRYLIVEAIICEESFLLNGVDTKYECLQINVAHTNPTTGLVQLDTNNQPMLASATLVLNGIWRPKIAADGTVMKNSGSMLKTFLDDFRGKTFSEVRDAINTLHKNKSFTVEYNEFIGESGVSSVMILNWVQ